METPLFVRWIRRSFWCWYDHLWGVIVLNILWTLMNLPWLVGGYIIVGFGLQAFGEGRPVTGIGILLIGLEFCLVTPPTAGAVGVLRHYIEGKDVSVREIFPQMKRYFWRGMTVGGLLILLIGVIFFNISFYGQLEEPWDMIGVGLTGFMLWGLFEVGVMSMFIFPVMVSQETDLLATFKYSLFFTLKHPVWGGMLFLASVGCLAFGIVSGIGLFTGATVTAFLVVSCGFRELVKAEIRKRDPGRVWPEDEERRSFREVIKPWEY